MVSGRVIYTLVPVRGLTKGTISESEDERCTGDWIQRRVC